MKQTGAFRHRSASSCTSEGAGDRTQDPQIKSLPVSRRKHFQNNSLQQSAEPVAVPVAVAGESKGGKDDPDLARLIVAWPTLSEPIRRAMLAILEATS